MKKKVLICLFSFIFCLAALNAKENQNITDKINSLLQDNVIELDNKELKSFTNKSFEKKIVTKLKKVDSTKDAADAVSDYIEVGNYELLNAIKLKNDCIFLNYLIRSDDSIHPKKESSEKAFGHSKIKHHVVLLYNSKKKQITEINYIATQYTPILFHKYEYEDKSILYGIGNNSSSGTATTDIYLLALSTENLELLFSECILFSQNFYSSEIQDIKFEKDFIFYKDKIVITGNDFDFKKYEYFKYDKIYSLEKDPLGFDGIPFGYTRDEVKTIMDEKGWKIEKEELSGAEKLGRIWFKKENADFCGIKVDYVVFYFEKLNIFYDAEIHFTDNADESSLTQISDFYFKRYGFKEIEESSKYPKYFYDSNKNFLRIANTEVAVISEELQWIIIKLKLGLD